MSLLRNRRLLNVFSQVLTKRIKPISGYNIKNFAIRPLLIPNQILVYQVPNLQIVRFKSKSKKSKAKYEASDSDDDEDKKDDDFDISMLDKSTKILTVKVNSCRTDLIVKSGLSMSRNKVEELFYEGKMRVNGNKVLKKSLELREGDEVDIIKELNPETNFLTVARVEVVKISGTGDSLSVKLKRCKGLLIENYDTPWTPHG